MMPSAFDGKPKSFYPILTNSNQFYPILSNSIQLAIGSTTLKNWGRHVARGRASPSMIDSSQRRYYTPTPSTTTTTTTTTTAAAAAAASASASAANAAPGETVFFGASNGAPAHAVGVIQLKSAPLPLGPPARRATPLIFK